MRLPRLAISPRDRNFSRCMIPVYRLVNPVFHVDRAGGLLPNFAAMKLPASQNLITAFILLMAFSQSAPAVNPPPDGGYPNGNTAEGHNALFNLTSGGYNTAVGFFALRSDTTGSFNTAVGTATLVSSTGDSSTAIGAGTLLSNTTGDQNTGIGAFVLLSNTDGDFNTATGTLALNENTTGSRNTAVGYQAMRHHQTGDFNNAFGALALINNVTGGGNNAIGDSALIAATGNNNTAIGDSAGQNLVNGNNNVYIGATGTLGVMNEDNHTYISNINNTPLGGAGTDTVTVNLATGLLGHLSSSQRYKEDIKSMGEASETLYRLKPVVFRYKKAIDRTQSRTFGLIAEQVADVNPDLVARNSQGQTGKRAI